MKTYSTTKKIDVSELELGMFVSSLEVAWSNTEFPLQGTLVRNQQDILKISSYGRTVTIDQSRSSLNLAETTSQPLVKKNRNNHSIKVHKQAERPWRKFCKQTHVSKKVIAEEIVHAKKLLGKVDEAFRELSSELKQISSHRVQAIKKVSNEIVLSLLENPDALLWLTKVKLEKSKIYDHAIRASIWATLMGRSMGLKTESLFAVNQAILLSSVGKAHLRERVWKNYKPTCMQLEYSLSSSLTVEKLSHCKDVEPQVMAIIANMTERFDGSGYPQNKKDKEIPYLSQIAALAESFDLILIPPSSDNKLTFGKALSQLYSLADSQFDGALIEEFIQATGLYPSGTQVILSNGYYGVVVEQSKTRRIRATVALTHDKEGYRLLRYQVVSLGERGYENIIIKKESDQHNLINEDMECINELIKNHQLGKFSRFISGIKSYFSN